MASWSFLTNHARVLLYIAHDRGARLRDIAAGLGITERSAHAIVADLTQAGYVVKRKEGRRNRYQIEAHLPLAEPGTREPAVGEVLALLLGQPFSHDGPPERTAVDQPDGADGITVGSTAGGPVQVARTRSSRGRRTG
jgi:DNA-binding transcriptional ArsR family regulator